MTDRETEKMEEPDDNTTGWNSDLQKLHCLIVLNDELGEAISGEAGEAFFRAFVVEDRKTGEVWCKMRFRYKDGDQWYVIRSRDKQHLPLAERIKDYSVGVENVMRTGLSAFAGGLLPPRSAVSRYYPPEPEDSEKTLAWLIAQDLIEMPVSKGSDTAT